MSTTQLPDPSLDLVLERVIDVPKELVWKAWTDPELLKIWFTPKPYSTREVELDLHPGGKFRVVMADPDGNPMDMGAGCVLEVIPNEKLVWTSALGPGYRPQPAPTEEGAFFFTCVLTLDDAPGGTRYRAVAIHTDEESRKTHETMGFHDGWGAALDQLVALVKSQQP